MTVFNDDGGLPRTPQVSAHERPNEAPRETARALRIGLNQLLLHGLPLEEQTAIVQSLGWSSLGLLRLSLWRFGEERTGDLVREAGLGVTSLSWAGGFTGTAGFTFREAVADGRLAMQEAAAVGAGTLVVAPGGRGGHTLRHAHRVAADGLKFLVDEAESRRIRLAVKCDWSAVRSQWSCLQTLDSARQLLDEVNSPAVGLACPIHGLSSDALAGLEPLANRIWLAWSNLPGQLAEPTAIERWQQRVSAALAVLMRRGFHGDVEFRPDTMTERCVLPTAAWPVLREAVAAVRQSLPKFSAVESGERPQAW